MTANVPPIRRFFDRAVGTRLALAAASAIAFVLAWSLISGGSYRWKLFGIRVRANDFTRPLAIGAALAAILLVYGWKRRAFRRVAVVLLAGFAVLALSAYSRQAQPYVPTGDMALLESYTIDASRAQLLVGPYSRFHWHHPGPIYFYILAPFYTLADHRTVGLWAGALWINVLSLIALGWTLLSSERARLGAVTLALTAIYLFRVREMLASPWNPHVIILPALLLVALSAAMAGGRVGLLPAVAALATFVVQTHVGLVPAVLALAGCSTAAAILFTVRSGDPAARSRIYRAVNFALWVSIVLWFLPLAEQFGRPNGNLAELWGFFTSRDRHGQPFGPAFRLWGETLSAMLGTGIHVGWGGVFRSRNDWIPLVLAVLQVSLLAVVAIRAARTGRQFTSALAVMLALTSIIGLWSATRIEDKLVDYAVFWLSGIGVLNLAVFVNEALDLLWRRPVPRPHLIAIGTAAAACAVVALLGFQQMRIARARAAGPGSHELTAMRLSDKIETYLRDHPGTKPLVEIDPPLWADAAGVIVEFQRKRIPFAVERNWLWMFTDLIAPAGDENAVLTIAREGVRNDLLAAGAIVVGEDRGVFAVLEPGPLSQR